MKLTRTAIPILLILFGLNACITEENELRLWYDEPGEAWTDALPVGNGRLAAMIYGRTADEVIQFNEETLWTGQPHDYAHEGAHEVLDELVHHGAHTTTEAERTGVASRHHDDHALYDALAST